MDKQMKILFYGLVVLVGILASTTTFFAAKSRSLNSGKTAVKSTQSPSTTSTEAVATPSPQVSTAVTRPATEKPSSPNKTYTIQAHETLFGIAQEQGTTLTELAEANGITDPNKIQAGQVLYIPENGQIEFRIDNTKATAIQAQVDQGKNQWRLSPEETARADAPGVYGLKVTDTYSLKNRDETNGQATVQASSEAGNFLVTLTQPITKGQKGIWAIETIKKI